MNNLLRVPLFRMLTRISRHDGLCQREFSSSKRPKVTITDDGQTIVCYHPEQKHAYEHTLPYSDIAANSNSVFKMENLSRGENLYLEQKSASLEDLQALTYTPKHVWERRRFDGLQMRPSHPRKGV